MFSKFKIKEESSRNIIRLITGTTIAHAIPIAMSPILTRIYAPEEFGIFALVMALSSILGTIVNGRYELAIMLPEDDNEAFNIAALCVAVAAVFSVLILVLVIFFNRQIVQLLGSDDIGIWLYFVPITVFLIGFYNVLVFFNNRMGKFADIAKSSIYKSLSLVVVQISIGLLKRGSVAGLVIGQIMSVFSGNLRLLKNVHSSFRREAVISIPEMKRMASRYIRFPKYSILSGLANTLTTHAVNVLISILYSVTTLGFYDLTQRVLGVPSALVGNAVGKVFLQQATKEKRITAKALDSFNSTAQKLIIIALPVFVSLFFIVEDMFAFVFGENWRIAGTYTKILIPLFAIRFVVSPLSHVVVCFEKQRIGLGWQVGLLSLAMMTIIFAGWVELSFIVFLVHFSIIISIYYIVFFVILLLISRGKI